MILHIEGFDCNLSIIQIFVESFLLVVTSHLPKRSAACQVIPRLQLNELLTVGWNHSSKFFLWKWIILPFYWFSEILPPPVTRLYIKWKLMNCVLDSRKFLHQQYIFWGFPLVTHWFKCFPISPMATPKLSGCVGSNWNSQQNMYFMAIKLVLHQMANKRELLMFRWTSFLLNEQKGSQNDVEIQIDSHEASIISRFGVLIVAKLEKGDVRSYASLPEDTWKSFRWCLLTVHVNPEKKHHSSLLLCGNGHDYFLLNVHISYLHIFIHLTMWVLNKTSVTPTIYMEWCSFVVFSYPMNLFTWGLK